MADEYDLRRFIRAQRPVYQKALGCLRKGTMEPTYMKFIFPRLAKGDGPPSRYSITSLDEARAYLSSPLLGGRYRECVGALLPLFAANVHAVFGEADARDLHASLTLFSAASPREFLLETMFEVWFDGTVDEGTMVELNRIS
ncbi:DUF1810 domain-containing protein (plasmid) [Aquamicrobium terrae]